MIVLTLKMSLKLGMKSRLVIILTINFISIGEKLSVQFLILGKKYSKKVKGIAQIQYCLIINCLEITRTLGIENMNSKEIYSIIMSSKINIPTSRIYFENKFPHYNFQQKDIYTFPREVTLNACIPDYSRSFQYKTLNKALYLNKTLHVFGLSNTQLYSLCKMEGETISPLFYYCS